MPLDTSAFTTKKKGASRLNLEAFGETTPTIETPEPRSSIDLGLNLTGTAGSTKQQTDFGTMDFFKGAGQGIARGYAATGARIASQVGLAENDTVNPKTYFGISPKAEKIGVAIFGKDKPFNATSEDIETLEAFGVEPSIAKGATGSLTLLLTATDLFTGGTAKGLLGATRALKAARTAEEAATIMRNANFAEDIINQYAEVFAKTKTTKETTRALEAAIRLQNETKLKGATPVIPKIKVPEQSVPSVIPFVADEAAAAARQESKTLVDEPVVRVDAEAPRRLTDTEILNAIDEIKASLPREKGPTVKGFTPDDLDMARTQLEIAEDVLRNNPARGLEKYASRSGDFEGGLREVTGEGKSRFGREGDQIITEFGFTDTEEAREAFLAYRKQKEQLESYKKGIKEISKDIRLAKEQDKYTADFQRAIQTRLKEKAFTLKQITNAADRARKAGFKKGAKETKRIEQRVAKRQVAVEKRNTRFQVAKAKSEIISKLRTASEASQAIKNQIVTFVKENLDPKDRGKALVLVRDAKTSKDLTKAFARVNRWAEDAEKKTVRNQIITAQKRIAGSPSIAIDYQKRIAEVVSDFELRGHNAETIERLQKTKDFLMREAQKGNDVEIPRKILQALETLNRKPFKDLTVNELRGALAQIETLEALGTTKLRALQNIAELQKEKILTEIVQQGAKPVQNSPLLRPEIGERLTITQKFRNFITRAGNEAARIDKAITPMDAIFDLLDGGRGTYDGANFRFFKGQVDAGYGRYITRVQKLQNPVIELIGKHGLDDTNFERIGVVAAREQDGGTEKLINSGFTKEQVEAVKLSKEEREVLNLMRETFDSQFPEIQDIIRRVYNKPVEKVKNYFSFMTDWKAMDDAEVFARFGSQEPEQYGAPRKNVEAGFTKSRVGGDQKIKINALDVFLKHTDNTSYLLELGETTKMLGEVAASPRYLEAVGDAGQLMVREWIDVVARKGGAAGASSIAALDVLRKNVGVGILGLKLSTIAIQPTSLIDGMGFIGVPYGMRGVQNFTTSADWRRFVGNMPEIKDRLGGEAALRELTDENLFQEIQRKGFIPLQKLDQMTAGMIAAGAYERKMVEMGKTIDLTKPYDPKALAYAQLAVRRTQSSGQFKDVPLAVSRGALTGNRSLDRAILQFQNFLLTRWSRIRHDALRAGINTKDPMKAVPVLTALMFAGIAASGIRMGVNRLTDFITGDEDDKTIDEELLRNFMFEMTGTVPFLGTAVSMALYDGEMFPILDAPKGVISGLNRVITSKSEEAKMRGFAEFAGSMGALLGIPGSAQAEQLIRGFVSGSEDSGGGVSVPSIKVPSIKTPSVKVPNIKI